MVEDGNLFRLRPPAFHKIVITCQHAFNKFCKAVGLGFACSKAKFVVFQLILAGSVERDGRRRLVRTSRLRFFKAGLVVLGRILFKDVFEDSVEVIYQLFVTSVVL